MTDEQEQTRIAKVAQGLVDLLDREGNNYDVGYGPELFKPEQSGTADLHLVRWGPNKIKRVAKSNKPGELLKTPRQRRHVVEKGYDTRNELQITTSIDHEGVVKLVDYYDSETVRPYGFTGPVLIQEYFPDSESLEEIALKRQEIPGKKGFFKRLRNRLVPGKQTESGRVSKKELYEITLQTAGILKDIHKGVGVLDGKPIVHRDLKPSNLLVQRKHGKIVAKLADCGNAGTIESQKSGYLPTMGGHIISDPLLMGVFTGEEREYTFQSDIYGLFSSILYLARGKPAVEYDPDTGEAKEVDSWKSVLGKDGKLDKEKHIAAIRKAAKSLPRPLQRVAERALTINEYNRYGSTDEFYKDLQKVASSSRLRKYGIAAAGIGLVIAGIVGGNAAYNTKKSLEQKVVTAEQSAKFEKRIKAIDHWLQRECDINLRKDPENKNHVFFTPDWNDDFEFAELDGWMSLLHPYVFEKNKYIGDSQTAMAAYLDSTLDKYPNKVMQALMQVNRISDPSELVRRIKEQDETLDLSFKSIEEPLEKLDRDLYYKVWSIQHRGSDNISRMIHSDRYQSAKVSLECAADVIKLQQQKEAEINGMYQKAKSQYGKPDPAPQVGDLNQFRRDKFERDEKVKIDAKYEKAMDEIRRSHFPAYSH